MMDGSESWDFARTRTPLRMDQSRLTSAATVQGFKLSHAVNPLTHMEASEHPPAEVSP